jgi:hypothetical protein
VEGGSAAIGAVGAGSAGGGLGMSGVCSKDATHLPRIDKRLVELRLHFAEDLVECGQGCCQRTSRQPEAMMPEAAASGDNCPTDPVGDSAERRRDMKVNTVA